MNHTQPKSWISSAFSLHCPRCRKGDLFHTPTFSFRKPFTMPDSCEHCQQPYMPEPGFYYGAMFISYIFMGWFCLFFVMFFHWVLNWSIGTSFLLLITVCLFLFVYIFRLARSLWIHIVVKYEPEKTKSSQ